MIHFRAFLRFCASAVVIGGVQLAGIVSGPSVNAQSIQASGVEPSLTLANVALARENKSISNDKSTKDVQTQAAEETWAWYFNSGYTSEYNFRGTNLTPDSDGAGFFTANVSRGGFTLGIYGIHQFGTARSNSFSIGEGGGGGSTGTLSVPGTDNQDNNLTFNGTVSPLTTQTRFNEVDLYLSYTHELGPLDITIGNIAFFIDRRAETRLTTTGTFIDGVYINGVLTDPNGDAHTYNVNRQTVNIPTVENETFDRLYIAVSAPRLFRGDSFYIVPKVYYYQTVFSGGQDRFRPGRKAVIARDLSPEGLKEEQEGFPHFLAINGVSERNTSLGGYLEGRIDGSFKVGERVTVQPYGLISASFHDRTEPYENPQGFRQLIRSRSLVGFNNAQAGVKVPIVLYRSHGTGGPEAVLTFAPFGAYSYHISEPPSGTDRHEVWGGAQLELTF